MRIQKTWAPPLINRAVVAHAQGDGPRAGSLLERAIGIWSEVYGVDHERLAIVLNNKCAASKDEDAGLRAWSISQRTYGPLHPITAEIVNNLAVVAMEKGRHQDADVLCRRAVEIWERSLGPDHEQVRVGLWNLAALYRLQGFFAEAEFLFQRAIKIRDCKSSAYTLGTFAMSTGNYLETALLRPVALRAQPLCADRPDAAQWLTNYAQSVAQVRETSKLNPAVGREMVQKLGPWYHNLALQSDIHTNPQIGEHPLSRWQILERFVPKNLEHKSVLDIGCNAGFFSIEMKKRGAERVVGVDVMPHVLAQARFASAWFSQPIELFELDVYDVESLGTFDFVIFVGVMYHLKHPLYALEKLAKVCKDTMYFQSVSRGSTKDFEPRDDYSNDEAAVFDLPEFPKLYLIERSFNGDASNWWFANHSALKAMLRIAGFNRIEETSLADTFVCHKK